MSKSQTSKKTRAQYKINPACDIFVSPDRVRCAFFDGIIDIKGENVGSVTSRIVSVLEKRKLLTEDNIKLLIKQNATYNASKLFQTLLGNQVLITQGVTQRPQVIYDSERADHVLYSSLPDATAFRHNQIVSALGFRVGKMYVLSLWKNKRNSQDILLRLYQWFADEEWLEWGRALFAPKRIEKMIVSQSFLPSRQLDWVRKKIAQITSRKVINDHVYLLDLARMRARKVPLRVQQTSLGRVGPFEPVVEIHQITYPKKFNAVLPYKSAAARYSSQVSDWDQKPWSWGTGITTTKAFDIAYAEAVERYCAGHYPMSRIKKGTRAESEVRINPYELIKQIPSQLKRMNLRVFDDHSPATWLPGIELLSGDKVEIIADLCLYPYKPPEGYGPYFFSNSSGMAAHRTEAKATKAAFLELVERDAFMRTWLGKKSLPRIPVEILPARMSKSLALLKKENYSLELINITHKKIPTVLAVLHRPKWPALHCGAAARLTFQEAGVAAYTEASLAIFGLLPGRQITENISPKQVISAGDHGKLYYNPKYLRHVQFLWSSDIYKMPQDPMPQKHSLRGVSRLAAQAGITKLYKVNYPCPVPALKVIRLDSPDMISITFGYGTEPQKMGNRNISTFPHPFS